MNGFKYGCLMAVIICLASLVKNSESGFLANPKNAFIGLIIATILFAFADVMDENKRR